MLETCVKNCGHRFHILVANRDFIDSVLVKIISSKNNPPTIVQDKVLALIQVGLPFLPNLLAQSKMGHFMHPYTLTTWREKMEASGFKYLL